MIKKNYNYFKIKKIISLEQERLKKLEEISSLAELFFKDELKYDPHLLFWKKMTPEEIKENLNLVRECLNNICPLFFKSKNIFKKIKKIGKEKGMGQVFWPWRVSLSGQKNSPPPQDIAEVLGKKRTIKRIEKAINSLK